MVSVKGKRFGFSWADEAEREEQEQEREKQEEQETERQKKQEKENQIPKQKEIEKFKRKMRPCRAEKPRVVILQENGFDWRKLDQEFNFRGSNKPMEINKKNPLPFQNSKCKNLPTEDFAVPPLKYPPKNINLVFEAIRNSCKDKPNTNPNFMPCQQTGTDKPDTNPIIMPCQQTGTDKPNSNPNFVPHQQTGTDKPDSNPNFMPRHQTSKENSTQVYRPVTISNLDPILHSNVKTSFDAKKESAPICQSEKQGKDSKSNFDFVWVKKKKNRSSEKRRFTEKREIVERKALVDLNSKFENSNRAKTSKSTLDSILNSNSNVKTSFDAKKESAPICQSEKTSKDTKRNSDLVWVKKEKTRSNEKRRFMEKREFGERKALVDLNSKFGNSNREKTSKSSNSYFGVLDLLEQSSEGKSENLKKRIKN